METNQEVDLTLCPFCDERLDLAMFNGIASTTASEPYVRFEVKCIKCRRDIFNQGEFGEFSDDDESKAEFANRFVGEFAKEWLRLKALMTIEVGANPNPRMVLDYYAEAEVTHADGTKS